MQKYDKPKVSATFDPQCAPSSFSFFLAAPSFGPNQILPVHRALGVSLKRQRLRVRLFQVRAKF